MNSGHRKRCRGYNTPGEAHELTFSCFWRLPLLSKDRSRQWFVEALDDAPRRRDFLVWAYLIMPEHVHVIVLRASFSGLLLRTPFTGRPVVLPQRLPHPSVALLLRTPFVGQLLRTPFTGFFAQRLGPPLTAGFQTPIISPAPFTGLLVFRLEPAPIQRASPCPRTTTPKSISTSPGTRNSACPF